MLGLGRVLGLRLRPDRWGRGWGWTLGGGLRLPRALPGREAGCAG